MGMISPGLALVQIIFLMNESDREIVREGLFRGHSMGLVL